jgi:hypothetical protein
VSERRLRVEIQGWPAGSGSSSRGRAWRARVANAAAGMGPASGVALRFTLEPTRWVDLDTLTEVAVAGLRDAGVVPRGLRGLDALLAIRTDGEPPGLVVSLVEAPEVAALVPPGPGLLDVVGYALPRRMPQKRAWRAQLATAWAGRPVLEGAVWADVDLASGSLLGPLEPTLDALEPVLGRDPRARPWQEFFPNDHHIVWLRVCRAPLGVPPVRLRLGRMPCGAEAKACPL